MADSASEQPSLTVLGGPMAGQRLVLDDAVANLLIGSDPSCDFYLPHDSVSPIHARLWVDTEGAVLHETGSPHGLHVNDERVMGQRPLRNGDIVWLGPPGGPDVVMIQCLLPEPEVEAAPEAGAGVAAAAPVAADDPFALGEDEPGSRTEVVEPGWYAEASGALETQVESAADDSSRTRAFSRPSDFTIPDPDAEASVVEPPPAAGAPPEEPELIAVDPAMVPEPAPLEEPAPFDPETLWAEPEATVAIDSGAMATVVPDEIEPTLAAPPAPPPARDLLDDFEDMTFAGPDEPVPAATTVPEPSPPPVPDAASLPAPGEPEEALEPEKAFAEEPTVVLPPPLPADAPTPPRAAAPSAAHPPTPRAGASEARPAAPRRAPPPVSARSVSPAPTPAATPARAAPRPPVRAARPSAAAARAPERPSKAVGGVVLAAGALLAVGATVGAYLYLRRPSPSAPVAAASVAPLTAPVTLAPPPATTLAATADRPAAAAPTPAELPSVAPQENLVTIVRSATPPPRPAPTVAPTAAAPPRPVEARRPAAVDPAAAARAQQAAQVASLLGQAQTALGTRNYEAAARLYDDVLRLDPQNQAALSGKAGAAAARAHGRRAFVPGRTLVQTEKAGRGSLAGFDSADVSVQKAPDFQGRIEFAMTPASVQPGDGWSLKIYAVNEGKKAIKISALEVATVVNGSRSGGGGAPRTREVAPQQRALLQEISGTWPADVSSWRTEVKVTASKGDSLQNQLTWK